MGHKQNSLTTNLPLSTTPSETSPLAAWWASEAGTATASHCRHKFLLSRQQGLAETHIWGNRLQSWAKLCGSWGPDPSFMPKATPWAPSHTGVRAQQGVAAPWRAGNGGGCQSCQGRAPSHSPRPNQQPNLWQRGSSKAKLGSQSPGQATDRSNP